MTYNRRNFLYLIGAATGTAVLGISQKNNQAIAQSDKPKAEVFTLPPLPYEYEALEPYINAETMRFHHDKHHGSFVKKLNQLVEEYPELSNKSAEELLKDLKKLPKEIQKTVRNNAGGHVNHTMFWSIMANDGGGEPNDAIAFAIDKSFGSFAEFQTLFNETGMNQFGSGWVWLVMDKRKQLKVLSTPNQDNPLMQGMYPIMGNDVWEHSYYLTYRNRRDEYLEQWWNVVNWNEVNQRFQQALNYKI
ncbi:superoxide dismutase [Chondrocystis sp. NIES-4102]|nr:superoxide dismutase [Chondrocystis sp. NIES-4102]